MTNLKPCADCGSEDVQIYQDEYCIIVCKNCGTQTGSYTFKEDAINHWNNQFDALHPRITAWDYFAGQALNGILTSDLGECPKERVAEWCAQYADAIMIEREKRMKK